MLKACVQNSSDASSMHFMPRSRPGAGLHPGFLEQVADSFEAGNQRIKVRLGFQGLQGADPVPDTGDIIYGDFRYCRHHIF